MPNGTLRLIANANREIALGQKNGMITDFFKNPRELVEHFETNIRRINELNTILTGFGFQEYKDELAGSPESQRKCEMLEVIEEEETEETVRTIPKLNQ